MAELRFPVPPLADDVVLLRPWYEADVPGKLLAFSDPMESPGGATLTGGPAEGTAPRVGGRAG